VATVWTCEVLLADMRPFLNRVGLNARDVKLKEALVTYLRIHANLGGFASAAARPLLLVPPPLPHNPHTENSHTQQRVYVHAWMPIPESMRVAYLMMVKLWHPPKVTSFTR